MQLRVHTRGQEHKTWGRGGSTSWSRALDAAVVRARMARCLRPRAAGTDGLGLRGYWPLAGHGSNFFEADYAPAGEGVAAAGAEPHHRALWRVVPPPGGAAPAGRGPAAPRGRRKFSTSAPDRPSADRPLPRDGRFSSVGAAPGGGGNGSEQGAGGVCVSCAMFSAHACVTV